MRRPWLIVAGLLFLVFFGGATLMTNDYLGWSPWRWRRAVVSVGFGVGMLGIGWWPVCPWKRVLLACVGLGALLYGLACVTGGWLGTAPWQVRTVRRVDWIAAHPEAIFGPGLESAEPTIVVRDPSQYVTASVVLVAVGLTLLVVAALPRADYAVGGGGDST